METYVNIRGSTGLMCNLYLNSFSLICDSNLIYVLLISFVGLCAVFFASFIIHLGNTFSYGL
jgi:hypothetical protein